MVIEKGSNNFEHTCVHEVDLANMAKDIEYIRKSLDTINGLPVEVALHKQSISKLWKVIWIFSVLIIGGVVTVAATALLSNP